MRIPQRIMFLLVSFSTLFFILVLGESIEFGQARPAYNPPSVVQNIPATVPIAMSQVAERGQGGAMCEGAANFSLACSRGDNLFTGILFGVVIMAVGSLVLGVLLYRRIKIEEEEQEIMDANARAFAWR
ncbi:hypothetical protein BKA70DRAFT_1270607 [Coprinopsis sp. MPI-PUGE-AT-0042]|nr:hypothetical protein BKA70DRAFT_1270607 [Coprinopsis sp. MPI-PUGE-AT-0042]